MTGKLLAGIFVGTGVLIAGGIVAYAMTRKKEEEEKPGGVPTTELSKLLNADKTPVVPTETLPAPLQPTKTEPVAAEPSRKWACQVAARLEELKDNFRHCLWGICLIEQDPEEKSAEAELEKWRREAQAFCKKMASPGGYRVADTAWWREFFAQCIYYGDASDAMGLIKYIRDTSGVAGFGGMGQFGYYGWQWR